MHTYIELSQWLRGKESACNVGNMGRRHGFHPWAGEIPRRKEMATHSSILAWEIPIHGAVESYKTGQLNNNKYIHNTKKIKQVIT